MDFDEELRVVFFEEADQLLEEAESAMMALKGECTNASVEPINKLFRIAHNFKGSARSVGLNDLSLFAHKVEDVLVNIKSGQLQTNTAVCSALLMAVDGLKAFIVGYKLDPQFTQDTTEIEQALRAIDSRSNAGAKPPGYYVFNKSPDVILITPQVVEDAPAPAPTKRDGVPKSDDDAIRVTASKLDRLLNLVGELGVNQSIMNEYQQQGQTGSSHAIQVLSYMAKLVSDIQDITMSLRKDP